MVARCEEYIDEFYAESISHPIPLESSGGRVNGAHAPGIQTQADLDALLKPTPIDDTYRTLQRTGRRRDWNIPTQVTQVVAVTPDVLEYAPGQVRELTASQETYVALPKGVDVGFPHWRYSVANRDKGRVGRMWNLPGYVFLQELDEQGMRYIVNKPAKGFVTVLYNRPRTRPR